jgi:serine/threonine-protein kinase HipA
MQTDELHVLVDGLPVGELYREHGQFIFQYDQNVPDDRFISLTMPVRRQPYLHKDLFPVFQMHLPEGYLQSVIKKQFSKISATDDFGMLCLLAPAIRGRISYQTTGAAKIDSLKLDDLIGGSKILFEELVERYALNSPVSGVQPKVLADLENRLTLKTDQFIVKAWGSDYPELALNEYLCTSAAKFAGLTVAPFYLSQDFRFFITSRFDKNEQKYDGFEDMCVLQAKHTADKYQGSYESVVKTIRQFVAPDLLQASLQQFFKMMVMNQMLQNGDAHLKNFGLVYKDVNQVKLAPVFDIVNTTAYISNDMSALTLLGSRKWWSEKHLFRFATEVCDIGSGRAKELFTECLDGLAEAGNLIESTRKIAQNQNQTNILDHLAAISQTLKNK